MPTIRFSKHFENRGPVVLLALLNVVFMFWQIERVNALLLPTRYMRSQGSD
jgi:hypothetical protein